MPLGDTGTIYPFATLQVPTYTESQELPLSLGIPLPEAWCTDARCLKIVDEQSQSIPASIETSALWPDKSIRWCLAHMRPEFNGGKERTIGISKCALDDGQNPVPTSTLEETNDYLLYSTPTRLFRIDKHRLNLVDVLDTQSKPIALGFLSIRNDDGKESNGRVSAIAYRNRLTDSSTVDLEVSIQGVWEVAHQDKIKVDCQLIFSGTGNRLDCRVRIHNSAAALHTGGLWDLGDPSSFHFKDFSAGLRWLESDTTSTGGFIRLDAESNRIDFSEHASAKQLSSGGANWNSLNHVDATGTVQLKESGYRATIDGAVFSGTRAEPQLTSRLNFFDQDARSDLWVTLIPRQFWQHFPTGVTGTQEEWSLQLFTAEQRPHELQPGEAKTRRFSLLFSNREPSHATTPRVAFSYSPEHISRCQLPELGVLTATDDRVNQLVQGAIYGEDSFFAKREVID